MAVFGYIGMGNMGYAMLKGNLKKFDAKDIVFTCTHADKMEKITEQTGVRSVESNAECANNAKYIILAVKPQVYDVVLKNIHNVIREDSVIISLAPGIKIEQIKQKLGVSARIVRAMPNTPALIGEGMTGVSYDAQEFTLEERDMLEKFFKSFGEMVIVPEKLMSSVVCATGSSPAYVYMFIEAMADSVVKYGIPRKDAYRMVAQMVAGSAKMVLETEEHPGVLKDNVCSPGGTTIKAVAALEENGFRNALFKATDACYNACES